MLLRGPLVSIHKALFARLSADLAPVKAYTYVPTTLADPYPFAMIHGFVLSEESTKGTGIAAVGPVIGIYSSQEGVLELVGLVDKVIHSVSRAPLDLEGGWQHQMTRLESCEALPVEVGEGELIQTAELVFRFTVCDMQVQT